MVILFPSSFSCASLNGVASMAWFVALGRGAAGQLDALMGLPGPTLAQIPVFHVHACDDCCECGRADPYLS